MSQITQNLHKLRDDKGRFVHGGERGFVQIKIPDVEEESFNELFEQIQIRIVQPAFWSRLQQLVDRNRAMLQPAAGSLAGVKRSHDGECDDDYDRVQKKVAYNLCVCA